MSCGCDQNAKQITNTCKMIRGSVVKYAEAKFYVQEKCKADLMVNQFFCEKNQCSCDEVKLIIKVSNLGPSNATKVVLNEILSYEKNANKFDVKICKIEVANGSYLYDKGVLTWNIGEVSIDESAIAVITILPLKPCICNSIAVVEGSTCDPNMMNNFSIKKMIFRHGWCNDETLLIILILILNMIKEQHSKDCCCNKCHEFKSK